MNFVMVTCAFYRITRHVFPGLAEHDLNMKAAKRYEVKQVIPSELNEDTINSCDQLLGDAETKETVDNTRAYLKKLEAAKMVTPLPKAKALPKARQRKCGKKDHESVDAAQKYKPEVAGCELSQYSEWDVRWRIAYPVDFPPFSHSCVFAEDNLKASREALFEVLRWAWTHHTRLTGEICPWNFEDEAVVVG